MSLPYPFRHRAPRVAALIMLSCADSCKWRITVDGQGGTLVAEHPIPCHTNLTPFARMLVYKALVSGSDSCSLAGVAAQHLWKEVARLLGEF